LFVPLFAAAQHFEWLSQRLALVDEFVRWGGIEFKHLEMTRYNQFRLDVPCQLGSLASA
jgi:hypothetical protein